MKTPSPTSPAPHAPNRYVSHFLRSLIGPEKPFETQKELAERAGMLPSTLTGTLRAAQVEPATIDRLANCLGSQDVKKLATAAALDAIPERLKPVLFDGEKLQLDESATLLSPLAEKMLAYLRLQARVDPMAMSHLEMQARWIGLDKQD